VAEFKRVEDVKGGAFDSRLPAPPLASYSNSWVSVSIAGGIEQSKHLADDSYSLQVRVVCVLLVVLIPQFSPQVCVFTPRMVPASHASGDRKNFLFRGIIESLNRDDAGSLYIYIYTRSVSGVLTACTDRFLMQQLSKGSPRSQSSFAFRRAVIGDNGMVVVISEKAYSSFVLRMALLFPEENSRFPL